MLSYQPSAAIPRSTVVAVIAATMIAQVASIMGVAVFPVIAPKLAEEMGVEPALVGYQVSLTYGAAMFASPFMSATIARWGACRATQVGLGLCFIGLALGLTSNLWGLVATSVLLGVALSVLVPASAHLLFRFSPPQNRNLVFSLKQTGVPFAWMLMALAAPAITLAFGWRWSLAAVLAVVLVSILALQPMRAGWDDDRDPRAAARQRPFEGLAVLWRYPILRWLSMASLFLSFVQLCLGAFAVTMLVQDGGYSLVAAGVIMSFTQAAGVIGRVAWGWVADRTGNSLGVLQKLTVIMIGCCLLAAFVSPAWPVVLTTLLFIAFGASAVGWNGVFLAEVARCSPRGLVSVATGGAMTWNFAGILIGPALFATVYKFVGSYALTYGLLALIAAAGLGLLLLCAAAARRATGTGNRVGE